jgi:hypothetical protein
MSNRDDIDWSSNELVNELSREPSLSDADDLIGVDWGDVGKKALSGSHVAGKTLLSMYGLGGVVAPLDTLYQREGLVEDWAGAPSVIVTNADYVVLDLGKDKPLIVKAPTQIRFYGGTRFDGTGYVPGEPFGQRFTFGMTDVPRVLVNDGKKETSYLKAKKVLVCGGKEEQVAAGTGIKSIVSGADMTDEELLQQAVAETVAPTAYVPAPPTMTQADMMRSRAYRTAMSRSQDMQARLAAAKARTPRAAPTFGPVSPMAVPDLTQYMRTNMDNELNDLVLGEIDEILGDDMDGDCLIGDADAEYEIVGGMSPKQRQKLEAYLAKLKKTIVSGDDIEVLGEEGVNTEIIGDADEEYEIVGGMSPKQRQKLEAYLAKLKKSIIGEEWVEIVGDDYIHGTDVLIGAVQRGATVPGGGKPTANTFRNVGQVQTKLANGNKQTQIVKPKTSAVVRGGKRPVLKVAQKSNKQSPHKRAVINATAVMNRALQAGIRATKRAAIAGKTQATVVHGYEILGATGKVPVTAKQKAAAAKRDKAVQKAAIAAAKTKKQGEKAIAASKKLAAALTKAKPVIAKLLAKVKTFPAPGGGATRVRGDDDGLEMDVSDSTSFTVGDTNDVQIMDRAELEVLGDQALQPGDPDYDFFYGDSQPDQGAAPASAPTNTYASGTTGGVPTGYAEVVWEDIPLPARGQTLTEEQAQIVQQSVPDNAVVYLMDKGLPADSVGSFSVMYDKSGLKDGYKYGLGKFRTKDEMMTQPDWVCRDYAGVLKHEGRRSGYDEKSRAIAKSRNANEMLFWSVFDGGDLANDVPTIERISESRESFTTQSVSGGSPEDVPAESKSPYLWGPLVGKPGSQLANLQYCAPTDQWFWQSEYAPKWATDAMDKEIERLNAEGRENAKQTNAANRAMLEQEQAERDRAAAAQEAELSMATNQAEVEAAITGSKLEQQQQLLDAQMAAQMAAMDMQAQKADLQWGINQENLEQRASKADLEYAIAHPEVAMQNQQYPQDGGEYEGEEPARGSMEEMMDQGNSAPDDEFAQAYDESQRDSGADDASIMDEG